MKNGLSLISNIFIPEIVLQVKTSNRGWPPVCYALQANINAKKFRHMQAAIFSQLVNASESGDEFSPRKVIVRLMSINFPIHFHYFPQCLVAGGSKTIEKQWWIIPNKNSGLFIL